MEAIVLAGGLGTRLWPITESIPKPMVEVAGRPFLEYLLVYLREQGITRVVLAVSYRYELIRRYFGEAYDGIDLRYSIEQQPLGTGGAVREALPLTRAKHIFLVNGDTYYQVPMQQMLEYHRNRTMEITLALKPMQNFSRYGAVGVREGRITAFEEKGHRESGHINGGVLVIDRDVFHGHLFSETFSLEKDLLMARLHELKIGGFVSNSYFVDIGVPEELERAQRELPKILPLGSGGRRA